MLSYTLGSIKESCSSNAKVDTAWKNALSCGWYFGYGKFRTSGKGLQEVHNLLGNTKESLKVIGCVAATMLFKFGDWLCTVHDLTDFAISSSAQYKQISITEQEATNLATKSVQALSPTFVLERDCPDN